MPFPKVQFDLTEENGDRILLEYLQDNLAQFSYLDETKVLIKSILEKIFKQKEVSIQKYRKDFIDLWPKILTEVLLNLKMKNTREWDESNPGMKSFFDDRSLGITNLVPVFEGFSKFEGMMYGASPDRYRDHVAHSFRVWIIGQAILKEYFSGRLACPDNSLLEISQGEWECMWAIVALCHDLGYPLSAIDKVNQKASDTLKQQGLRSEGDLRFSFSQQMLPFHESIIKLMSSRPINTTLKESGLKKEDCKYLTHLQNKYYLKFLKSFDNLDHGIISSLLLSGSLVYFLESDLSQDDHDKLSYEDARQFLIRREILRAISSHTCQDIYHFQFNTLSFLLYLVDEIQCWGRPTFEQLQYSPETMGKACARVKKLGEKVIEIEIEYNLDKVWDKDQQKAANESIWKLRKMLRLAVDTNKVADDTYIKYAIKNVNGQSCHLELKNKEIKIKNLEEK